ncbi:MAG: methyl-accepting chemotaxis protein [Lachnoclostridium sp.]|nr:methyl-accepting chemotaxis protein [Lachnoclostridium sp.]
MKYQAIPCAEVLFYGILLTYGDSEGQERATVIAVNCPDMDKQLENYIREMRGRAMERERKEINKVSVFCHTAVVSVILLAYALEVVKGARTIGYYGVFFLLAAIPVVFEWILYKRNGADKKIQHSLAIGYGIFYVFVIFTTTDVTSYTFAIPMYLVILLYSDLRYCVLVSTGGFLANLVFAIYQAVTVGIAQEALKTYEIRVLLMLIVAVFLCAATKVMAKINQMKMDELKVEKDNTERLLQHTMQVSGEMSRGIEEVADKMGVLGGAVLETRNAMQEVSTSTNETADAIQNQIGQTEEIQRHIEQVENVSQSINDSMEQSRNNITDGKQSLEVLLEQVESSDVAGQKVVADIDMLKEYMSNMQSIIEIITNVADQTGLLALNASIEAARAGEAGRGFAVVASEISGLANQTQSATVNITDVIKNVSDKLTIAVDAIEELMQNNAKQNESAAVVAESFEKISESIGNADNQSRILGEVVGELAAANSGIIEGVQTVSAVMEEVSAHSGETYNISDKNADIVSQVSKLVEDLNVQAQSLNNN